MNMNISIGSQKMKRSEMVRKLTEEIHLLLAVGTPSKTIADRILTVCECGGMSPPLSEDDDWIDNDGINPYKWDKEELKVAK